MPVPRAEDGVVGPRVHLQVLEAELVQLQLAQHGREMDHDVRRRADIDAVTRDEIVLRANCAAHNMPPFQHDHAPPRTREITGAGKPVVARTDYRDIVGWHEGRSLRRGDGRDQSDEFRPGANVISKRRSMTAGLLFYRLPAVIDRRRKGPTCLRALRCELGLRRA